MKTISGCGNKERTLRWTCTKEDGYTPQQIETKPVYHSNVRWETYESFKRNNSLPEAVVEAIKSTYRDLVHPDLLRIDAVLTFNDGNIGRIRVLKQLNINIVPGIHTVQGLQLVDKTRIAKAHNICVLDSNHKLMLHLRGQTGKMWISLSVTSAMAPGHVLHAGLLQARILQWYFKPHVERLLYAARALPRPRGQPWRESRLGSGEAKYVWSSAGMQGRSPRKLANQRHPTSIPAGSLTQFAVVGGERASRYVTAGIMGTAETRLLHSSSIYHPTPTAARHLVLPLAVFNNFHLCRPELRPTARQYTILPLPLHVTSTGRLQQLSPVQARTSPHSSSIYHPTPTAARHLVLPLAVFNNFHLCRPELRPTVSTEGMTWCDSTHTRGRTYFQFRSAFPRSLCWQANTGQALVSLSNVLRLFYDLAVRPRPPTLEQNIVAESDVTLDECWKATSWPMCVCSGHRHVVDVSEGYVRPAVVAIHDASVSSDMLKLCVPDDMSLRVRNVCPDMVVVIVTGLLCHLDDACTSNPCHADAICDTSPINGSYTCSCASGYKGVDCSEDIDECEQDITLRKIIFDNCRHFELPAIHTKACVMSSHDYRCSGYEMAALQEHSLTSSCASLSQPRGSSPYRHSVHWLLQVSRGHMCDVISRLQVFWVRDGGSPRTFSDKLLCIPVSAQGF
ncbi:hypothetical protein PR048_022635 [Dryococelus australis]|uniref:EGF-like domain-containing protein n=1 Tax=Dryococelus australis TaxID=614101 RepID=A0ABQ9H1W0_9NEOP|nr:hypothetical protein PR048_022635 [Dryococelus australis]